MRPPNAARIVSLFETFAPADVARLSDYYGADAQFKDPFNEVQGLAAIQRIFEHMFETLEEPRFVVTRCMAQDGECWLAWEFSFRQRALQGGRQQRVRGASHLMLDSDGLIQAHRDYWDPAEEVYEKLPILGTLMRWLKRRGSAGLGGGRADSAAQ